MEKKLSLLSFQVVLCSCLNDINLAYAKRDVSRIVSIHSDFFIFCLSILQENRIAESDIVFVDSAFNMVSSSAYKAISRISELKEAEK